MLLVSVFGILALAVLIVFGSRYLRPVSDLKIPTPVMPSPNAFDYANAAGNAIQDDHKVVDAYFDFTVTHSGPFNSPARSAGLVRENQAALKMLRKGFAYSYLSPPMRSINDKAPYLSRERDLARLLAVEGQVKAAHGDWNGVAQSDLDAIQMGEQIPHGAVIIGDLVGFACQAIGRRPFWAAIDHLSAAQAKAAARRLEQIQALAVPCAQTLQEEEWFGQAAMLGQFRTGVWGPVPEFMQSIYLRRYTRYMDNCIADARLPYAAKPPTPDPPEDIVNAIFAPVLLHGEIKDADNRTQNSLLLVHLALRAYRVEHHEYPATLEMLAPDYLPCVPADPFALAGPLRYRRVSDKYVLYSVGPDGKDDGGKPIFDSSKPAPKAESNDPRYWVRPDSRGDIVAEVSR